MTIKVECIRCGWKGITDNKANGIDILVCNDNTVVGVHCPRCCGTLKNPPIMENIDAIFI